MLVIFKWICLQFHLTRTSLSGRKAFINKGALPSVAQYVHDHQRMIRLRHGTRCNRRWFYRYVSGEHFHFLLALAEFVVVELTPRLHAVFVRLRIAEILFTMFLPEDLPWSVCGKQKRERLSETMRYSRIQLKFNVQLCSKDDGNESNIDRRKSGSTWKYTIKVDMF